MHWGDKDVQEFVKNICDNYEDAREDDVYSMLLQEYDANGGKIKPYARASTFENVRGWLNDSFTKPVTAQHIAMYRRSSIYFRLLKKKEVTE